MTHGTTTRTRNLTPTSTTLSIGLLQRKCACGQNLVAGEECDKCREEQLNVQRSSLYYHNAGVESEEKVPPIVYEVLNSPGQPLDSTTRAFFEPRFRQDFSQVRVHTDSKAAGSARAVNALAYTVGRNVVFGKGLYKADVIEGRRLVAHELAHVVQQRGSTLRKLAVSKPDDKYEREAQRIADEVMRSSTTLWRDGGEQYVDNSGEWISHYIKCKPSITIPHSAMGVLQREEKPKPALIPHAAPAGPVSPPPGAVPGSWEAMLEDATAQGERIGRIWGPLCAEVDDERKSLIIAGEDLLKRLATVSPNEATAIANRISGKLYALPIIPTYSDQSLSDAAIQGFQRGFAQGYEDAKKMLYVNAFFYEALQLVAGGAAVSAEQVAGRALRWVVRLIGVPGVGVGGIGFVAIPKTTPKPLIPGPKVGLKVGMRLPQATGMGFNTFEEFKAAFGGFRGSNWHHIVEQNSENIKNFGATRIHNTNNLILIDDVRHGQVSAIYSGLKPGTNITYASG